ncbi:interleukin-15 receptor subunit alpha [Zonotrichia albicollis]|uniref:interleukin-15 receptor subunit alpha n=1 Tax=Zonotrichia albicollis TaxID=44394 RepID=UPI003D8125B1
MAAAPSRIPQALLSAGSVPGTEFRSGPEPPPAPPPPSPHPLPVPLPTPQGGASLPVPGSKAKAKPLRPHRDGDSGREAPRSCRRTAELPRAGAMAPPLLPLLCGTAALLLLRAAADSVHCSPPKAVANAHIDAGNRTELHSRLRYSCNPGYKRKAGTSSLIQCVLWNGSRPRWTDPSLQCIRDPALSREGPGAESTTQGITGASPNPSPSPAPSESPVPPAPHGPSPDGSRPPEMVPTPDTATLGEGTTALPVPPSDSAAVSIQSVASSVGLLALLAIGIAACCCWRRRRRRK